MISKDLRSQFSILLFCQQTEKSQVIKAELFERGYEVFAFIDQETLISRVTEAAPHIIIFEMEALEDPIHLFMERILEQNQEILFVGIANSDLAGELKDLQEYNFAAFVPAGECLPVRVAWALDELCTGLLRVYQNEKLLNDKREAESRFSRLEEQYQKLSEEKSAPPVEISWSERLKVYQWVESKEDVIHSFFKTLPSRALFFKFLPTVNSFVATIAQGIDIETLKGVGCRLQPEEVDELPKILAKNELPSALLDLVKNGLRATSYIVKPVMVSKSMDGIVILWGEGISQVTSIENLFLLFSLKYQEIHLLKRSENFDVFDSLTELHNRSYYFKKVDEEIARSKRIHRAVSVLRVKVDNYDEIAIKVGANNRDLIVRTIASIIKKTSRINDISACLGPGEFGLILVHCARKGAALRAERLRRIVEGHSFAMNDLKVTLSAGVSEYPSFASTVKDLDESATRALEFIQSRGGNKVCLYKPHNSFRPDFEVEAI